jgi:phosphoribosylformimino-5-aminoimidazole carboxamide ribonucleotide (ProFAR) isomerase
VVIGKALYEGAFTLEEALARARAGTPGKGA